jgi:predicted dehydrogenase
MNEQHNSSSEFNRRDFLRGGSVATLMTMLGGVDLFAQTNTAPGQVDASKLTGSKIKLAVIGLGPWGREILTCLTRQPQADIAAVCDNYEASLRRGAKAAPGSTPVDDYKKILENKDIKAVIIATPTHLHKALVLESLAAGKHVYCEAPLATTIEDAKAIATAAKEAGHLVFQAGLQLRADPQRHFLLPFIRSGALGQPALARAQWHKKQSWRSTSPNADREKALNWRLSKETSLGLIGELSIHQVDQVNWFWNGLPTSATGFGTIAFYKDGRDVADTVNAVLSYPGNVCLNYDATLANSFDAAYEMFYGSDAAVMLRESNAWMFKETDSPLLGWEVYAKKDVFYKETGIALRANASKSTNTSNQPPTAEELITSSPLFYSLQAFVRNAADLVDRAEDMEKSLGEVDQAELAKVPRRACGGYLEGYQATVSVIKANEAIASGTRVEIKPELYELG